MNTPTGIYKQAFLETLIRQAGKQSGRLATKFTNLGTKATSALNKARSSIIPDYVVDAVQKARPQFAPGTVDNSFTLHGQLLKSLDEYGAFGAKQLRHGLDKIRMAAETADTGLGAWAIGKKGLETKKGFRYNLFSYKKRNWLPYKGNSLKNPLDPSLGLKYQAERPSITAPLDAIGATAVPTMAILKGNEIIEQVSGKRHKYNV